MTEDIDTQKFRAAIAKTTQAPSPNQAVFDALGVILAEISPIAFLLQDHAAEAAPHVALHGRAIDSPIDAITRRTLALRAAIQFTLVDLNETLTASLAALEKPPPAAPAAHHALFYISSGRPFNVVPNPDANDSIIFGSTPRSHPPGSNGRSAGGPP